MKAAGLTLQERLRLEPAGADRWRSLHGDPNQNGRSYGGQLLGQALRAALLQAPPERAPTMMQFVFLQGAMPDQAIDFEVTPLQAGKRFTSLRVQGRQSSRQVLHAHVTCALPLEGPTHAEPTEAPPGERPDRLPALADVPADLMDHIARFGGYGRDCNPAVEFRIPEPQRQLAAATATRTFRYWMKVPQPLPEDPHLHASAFAYLSDWWLNFCIMAPHLPRAGERPMYISSLNHTLWFHALPRADRWIHVCATGVHAAAGRGLATAQYHDEQGRHLATSAQDCLLAWVD